MRHVCIKVLIFCPGMRVLYPPRDPDADPDLLPVLLGWSGHEIAFLPARPVVNLQYVN